MGQRYVKALSQLNFKLVGICDQKKDKLKKFDNIICKKTLIKSTRGKKVKKKGFKKAIITLKKGQNIDLTTGI